MKKKKRKVLNPCSKLTSLTWSACICPTRVGALRTASCIVSILSLPTLTQRLVHQRPPETWLDQNSTFTGLPVTGARRMPLDLGLLFCSIWNKQNSGPITWPREPLRTGNGPIPKPSLWGKTEPATLTLENPPSSFPPQGFCTCCSLFPRLFLCLTLSHRFGFSSYPQKGLLCPLPLTPSFSIITGILFWITTPPPVDPVLVKLSIKVAWSPLAKELRTFCPWTHKRTLLGDLSPKGYPWRDCLLVPQNNPGSCAFPYSFSLLLFPLILWNILILPEISFCWVSFHCSQ